MYYSPESSSSSKKSQLLTNWENYNNIININRLKEFLFSPLFLFPLFSHPVNSRFKKFFESMFYYNNNNNININIINTNTINNNININSNSSNNNNNNNQTYMNKKRKNKIKTNMEINISDIKKGIDKRTSLIIKNLSVKVSKKDVIENLCSLVKLNFIYVPEDEETHRILGFAFINVGNYLDIINLFNIINLSKSKHINCLSNSNKKIQICYNQKQGLKALVNTFGNYQRV